MNLLKEIEDSQITSQGVVITYKVIAIAAALGIGYYVTLEIMPIKEEHRRLAKLIETSGTETARDISSLEKRLYIEVEFLKREAATIQTQNISTLSEIKLDVLEVRRLVNNLLLLQQQRTSNNPQTSTPPILID